MRLDFRVCSSSAGGGSRPARLLKRIGERRVESANARALEKSFHCPDVLLPHKGWAETVHGARNPQPVQVPGFRKLAIAIQQLKRMGRVECEP